MFSLIISTQLWFASSLLLIKLFYKAMSFSTSVLFSPPLHLWDLNLKLNRSFWFRKTSKATSNETFYALQKEPFRGVLSKMYSEICSKFTGEHPCRSVLCNFTEIILWHGCSPVNLLHIFKTPFTKNTFRWLLLVLPSPGRIGWKCSFH